MINIIIHLCPPLMLSPPFSQPLIERKCALSTRLTSSMEASRSGKRNHLFVTKFRKKNKLCSGNKIAVFIKVRKTGQCTRIFRLATSMLCIKQPNIHIPALIHQIYHSKLPSERVYLWKGPLPVNCPLWNNQSSLRFSWQTLLAWFLCSPPNSTRSVLCYGQLSFPSWRNK